jgi:hypothetical protein
MKLSIILEHIQTRQLMSEHLKFHISNKQPISENVFRGGSDASKALIIEARKFYDMHVLKLEGVDKYLYENTDIGRLAKFKNETVILDLPFIAEATTLGVSGMKRFALKHGFSVKSKSSGGRVPYITLSKNGKKYGPFDPTITTIAALTKHVGLNEADYQGKDVELNKPKRGGPKKFYVYVKNPSTGKVRKIAFGDTTGLSVKLNDPAARKSFAARHKCAQKTDRTKASYWSCRLPRYAKLLGLKSSFSGFW